MPVSFLPLIIPALLIGIPLLLLMKGWKTFAWAAAISLALVTSLFLAVYVPGWVLAAKARRGEATAMYELARWTERHDEQIGAFILWPVQPDVLGGYDWLEKAAALEYPPAVYAVGVRLKYGQHVPQPPDWRGPAGNVFAQPERGQALIDKAIRLGYRPTINEEFFYWQQYRK
jgi:TPR repeat protein